MPCAYLATSPTPCRHCMVGLVGRQVSIQFNMNITRFDAMLTPLFSTQHTLGSLVLETMYLSLCCNLGWDTVIIKLLFMSANCNSVVWWLSLLFIMLAFNFIYHVCSGDVIKSPNGINWNQYLLQCDLSAWQVKCRVVLLEDLTPWCENWRN